MYYPLGPSGVQQPRSRRTTEPVLSSNDEDDYMDDVEYQTDSECSLVQAVTRVNSWQGRLSSGASDVEVNTDDDPLVFKAQLFALTGVQPERQKVMLKGMTLKDNDWGNMKIDNGAMILMMGSKEEDVPTEPIVKPVFVEDMNEAELATASPSLSMQVVSHGINILMPASKKSPSSSFPHFSTSSFTSSSIENSFLLICTFREVKRWKSEAARSREGIRGGGSKRLIQKSSGVASWH
ncbi:Ubiquitin carboxyl-terminal hydrolase 14 [Homalodisca vitripennis]|nr:Ubiquitin carboxyl-terminal hydrolase 14 [Homalodisca vitripennis]